MRRLAFALGLALAACTYPYPGDYVADAGGDGRPPDGPRRAGPLVQNGQLADLVLGQAAFDVAVDRGVDARGFRPDGLAFANGRLWTADFLNSRVLGWDAPTVSDAPATYVLGQLDFTSRAFGTSATLLNQPTGVVAAGQRVMVLDGYNHRVLIWNQPPTAPGQAADLVLGAATMTEAGAINVPVGGWSDGASLIVRSGFTDPRLWLWRPPPTQSGASPTLQLVGAGPGPGPGRYGEVGGVASDGVRLVVADQAGNRVLIWNTIPTSPGVPADVVVGQPTFDSEAPGSTAATMRAPHGVLIVDGALVVADAGNDRVLVFDPIPEHSGALATQVLGQLSPNQVAAPQPPSERTLSHPEGLAVAGRSLFVADRDNRRILRFALALP